MADLFTEFDMSAAVCLMPDLRSPRSRFVSVSQLIFHLAYTVAVGCLLTYYTQWPDVACTCGAIAIAYNYVLKVLQNAPKPAVFRLKMIFFGERSQTPLDWEGVWKGVWKGGCEAQQSVQC